MFRKKIIYDFDDAIWTTDNTVESQLVTIIRWRKKVHAICAWSYKVSCGNEYLRTYASQFNTRSFYNPTTIETDKHLNRELLSVSKKANNINIGWTGSHSTLKYLTILESCLKQIENMFPNVTFIVIANKRPELNLRSLKYIPWSEATEIEDLLSIDIGIMPLPDDEWSKGKCGFKVLQYMALEIPALASPVGVNTRIIHHGKNGFLCASESEWLEGLSALIQHEELREQFGKKGRKTVVKNYSVASNSTTFLSLFN